MEARDIIIKPILTEKSYDDLAAKKYTFIVDVRANKTEIQKAVEEVFGVKVKNVNTLRQIGKVKRQGYTSGRRPEYKKAFVTLKKDSKTIEFFDSLSK
jgi:large subunit ribosomal protein L23